MAIFLLFYKLLLEKESMHKFKRFYLLSGVMASFIIPGLVFVEYIEPTLTSQTVFPISYEEYSPIINEQPKAINILNWPLILWSIYGLGAVGFGLRFFRHLFQILKRIKNNPKIKQNFITKVLLREKMPPHTFFSFIFLNKTKFESNAIPNEILTHEQTHAKQYHSIDVLFIELLQVVFWFNPLIYLFKKSIKLNHEFLADRAVIEAERDTINYQNTLLSYLSHESLKKYQSTGMSNAINYSSIKKRFTIMKKRTSKKAVVLRTLLLVPLCAVLLYGFSEVKYVEKEIPQSELMDINEMFGGTNFVAQDTLTIEEDNGDILEGVSIKKNPQINATRAQMAEYNSMAKKYNQMLSKEGDFHIEGADIERLEYIYALMSDKQKLDAEPFPDFPEPPTPPEAPNTIQSIISPASTPSHGMKSSTAILEEPITVLPKVSYVNAPAIDTQLTSVPKTETENNNQWVVSSGVNPNSRDDAYAKLPPPAPAIAKHINTDDYSSELKSALKLYLNSIKAYEQNVQAYRKDEKGSLKNINIEFDKIMELYTNYYELAHKENRFIQPPAPPAPQSPLDHVIDMAKKGATFYFEGKEISSDRAIELLKKNKSLNISTTKSSSKNPQVKISKNSILTKKSSASKINLETGNITVNGSELFYSTKNGITSYFNTKGEQVDRQGKKLEGQSTKHPTFYFNGNKISSTKAHQLLKNNRSIQVATEDYTEDVYAVVLTDLSTLSYNKNPNKNNNPNSFIDLTEMIEKEALFFYNDKPISNEKALWLTKNTQIERVNTKGSKNGKPKVYLWKKN